MVGEDEWLYEVKVEIGGDFFWVETAAVGVIGGVAYDGQFLQLEEFNFNEVANLAEVDAFELVLVQFGGRLEDVECDVVCIFLRAYAYLVDEYHYLPEVGLVLVVVAGELLVNLLRNLSKLATVGVVQVKLSHVVAKTIVFLLDRVFLAYGLPLLDFEEEGEFIIYIFTVLFEGDDVVFGTCIGALVGINGADNSEKDCKESMDVNSLCVFFLFGKKQRQDAAEHFPLKEFAEQAGEVAAEVGLDIEL